MRYSIDKLFDNLGYCGFMSTQAVYDTAGILYYALTDSDSYGYITKDKIEQYTSAPSFVACQESFLDEEAELLQKRGVKSNKWGNLLKAFFGDDIEQSFIDKFILKFKAHNATNNSTTFVIRDDIVEAYRETDLSSCMSGSDADKTRLLEALGAKYLSQINDEGDEISRSLLWDNVRHLNANGKLLSHIKLCDRIYSKDTDSYVAHAKHAAGMGYYIRSKQNYTDKSLIAPPGDYLNSSEMLLGLNCDELNVTEGDINDILWPYMDTFTFFKKDPLSFFNTSEFSDDFYLNNTDGESFYRSANYSCNGCEYEDDDDDNFYIVDGERYCNDCATTCDHCDDPVLRDNLTDVARTSLSICSYCVENSGDFAIAYDNGRLYRVSDLAYCEDIERYVYEDYKYCETYETNYYHHEDLIKIDGKYYLDTDTNIIMIEGDYYLSDDPDRPKTEEELKELELVEVVA